MSIHVRSLSSAEQFVLSFLISVLSKQHSRLCRTLSSKFWSSSNSSNGDFELPTSKSNSTNVLLNYQGCGFWSSIAIILSSRHPELYHDLIFDFEICFVMARVIYQARNKANCYNIIFAISNSHWKRKLARRDPRSPILPMSPIFILLASVSRRYSCLMKDWTSHTQFESMLVNMELPISFRCLARFENKNGFLKYRLVHSSGRGIQKMSVSTVRRLCTINCLILRCSGSCTPKEIKSSLYRKHIKQNIPWASENV